MERTIFTQEHQMFRQAIRAFVARECVPHHKQWEQDGIVPRELWLKAGQQGYLCMDVPEQYGGGGVADFRYATIMTYSTMAMIVKKSGGFRHLHQAKRFLRSQ